MPMTAEFVTQRRRAQGSSPKINGVAQECPTSGVGQIPARGVTKHGHLRFASCAEYPASGDKRVASMQARPYKKLRARATA